MGGNSVFSNFVKVAFRSLNRNRIFTIINVLGLSLGVAFALLATTYLRHELSWDKHISGHENVYRIVTHYFPKDSDSGYDTSVSSLLKPEIDNKISGLETVTRLSTNERLFRKGENQFPTKTASVDPSYFATFCPELVHGDPGTALDNQTAILVSESFAEKYYGAKEIIGELVDLELDTGYTVFQVTGVYSDLPKNALLRPDVIYNYEVDYSIARMKLSGDWGWTWSETFVRLAPGTSPIDIERGIADITHNLGVDVFEDGARIAWELQPVSEVHVSFNNPRGFPTETETVGIYVLGAIAIVILLLACINFTTLTIGRSTLRATEVGMRKVLGANRIPLMIQFWVETGIVALASVLFGFLLAKLAMPEFVNLAQRELILTIDWLTLAALFTIWFIVVFIAGSYPSVVVSAFKPADAFKGEVRVGGKARLRKALVFVQFVLSIVLITGTIVMKNQLHFVSTKALGFNGDQVVMIEAQTYDNSTEIAMDRFRDELKSDPRILSISGAANAMNTTWFIFGWDNPDGSPYENIRVNTVDPEWMETLEIPLLAGRGFDPARNPKQGIAEIIVNEKSLEYFGLEEDALGKSLPTYEGVFEIVGIMPDIHVSSLHEEIRPTILMRSIKSFWANNHYPSLSMSSWYTIQRIFVRVSGDDIAGTIATLESTWSRVAPDKPFDYSFVDEGVAEMYKEDRRWNSIVNWASGVALFIAALGLVGLSTLEVTQRRREISIRKVLGASEGSLIFLLTRQISLIVVFATAFATPLSWIFMQKWLNDFAYRITLSPFWMLLAGVATLAVAWICVGGLAWKSATTNPIKAIRHE